jgi:glycosyltransferase involved in cell wall biosynthesis
MERHRVKVLIVMSLAHRHGGAENILWTLLKGIDRSRFELGVAFLDEGPFRDEVMGLDISTWTIAPRESRPRHALTALTLARIFRREQPDIILSWLAEAQLYGGAGAVLSGKHRRNSWWQANIPTGNWIERVVTALPARTIFAYSHATARAQQRIRPTRQVSVIYPGIEVPPRLDGKARNLLRSQLGLPSEVFTIGIVGRLCSWKGQHHVVRAVQVLRARGLAAHGLIVGGDAYDLEPEYERRLRSLPDELGVSQHVTLTGQVHDATRHMQLMDVVVNASQDEPFGIVLLEAMALEIPVIAVASGGPSEVIEHGESGFLVPSPDGEAIAAACQHLLDSPTDRGRLVRTARRRFEERFTAERMVAEIEHQLRDLASEGSVGSSTPPTVSGST